MCSSRGGGRESDPLPFGKSQKYRVPFHTVPDPQKNHKATKAAFNVGPSLACQLNAI